MCSCLCAQGVAAAQKRIFSWCYNNTFTDAPPIPTPLIPAVSSVAIIAQSIHPMSTASCQETQK